MKNQQVKKQNIKKQPDQKLVIQKNGKTDKP